MRLDLDLVDELMEEDKGDKSIEEDEWISDDESGNENDSEELIEERFQEEQERNRKLERSVQQRFATMVLCSQ